MRVLVVGSGAGGATVARELAGKKYNVTILEAGKPFKPFTRRLSWTKPLRRAGLLGKEGTISRFFKPISTVRSSKDLALFRGITTGGSTSISCGNIVRADRGLKEMGLNLTPEFDELEKDIGITTIPKKRWRPLTLRMFETAEKMDLNPQLTPKAVEVAKCVSCGLCELGCVQGAKWDSRKFLYDAIKSGAELQTNEPVEKIIIKNNQVKGVIIRSGRNEQLIKADIVVLAAGGIGTPQILRTSCLSTKNSLWVDIVLTLGGVSKGSRQLEEPPMVWYAKKEDYIISPYIDILSHWFHKPWRKVPLENRVGVMVKLADLEKGSVDSDGSVHKAITTHDRSRLNEGVKLAEEIMKTAGVSGPFVEGLYNGGHLGGTVPLRKKDINSMKSSNLPDGLWVADLSLAPKSQGLPTILLTAALALRVARKIAE